MNKHQELLQKIEWKDLLHLSFKETLIEFLLPWPWFIASLYAAHLQWYVLALFFSFMFFLVMGRLSHAAIHNSLGITRQQNRWVLILCSFFILSSMHAIQINHIRHHRLLMQDEDIEAMSAKMPWWKALLIGPWYTILLHIKAFQIGNEQQRKWMMLELMLIIILISAIFFYFNVTFLKFHVIAMLFGQSMTAFFAGWLVHHDTEDHIYQARTLRSHLKGKMSYSMFYHVEHHLFPSVPAQRLHIIAQRLDAYHPDLKMKKVF